MNSSPQRSPYVYSFTVYVLPQGVAVGQQKRSSPGLMRGFIYSTYKVYIERTVLPRSNSTRFIFFFFYKLLEIGLGSFVQWYGRHRGKRRRLHRITVAYQVHTAVVTTRTINIVPAWKLMSMSTGYCISGQSSMWYDINGVRIISSLVICFIVCMYQ